MSFNELYKVLEKEIRQFSLHNDMCFCLTMLIFLCIIKYLIIYHCIYIIYTYFPGYLHQASCECPQSEESAAGGTNPQWENSRIGKSRFWKQCFKLLVSWTVFLQHPRHFYCTQEVAAFTLGVLKALKNT